MDPTYLVAGIAATMVAAISLYSLYTARRTAEGYSAIMVERLHAALEDEKLRVTELMHLLEAKSAPVEYAAYMDPTPRAPEPEDRRLYSEDGLLVSEAPWGEE